MKDTESEGTAAAFAFFFTENEAEFQKLAALDALDIGGLRLDMPTGRQASAISYAGFFSANKTTMASLASERAAVVERAAHTTTVNDDGTVTW